MWNMCGGRQRDQVTLALNDNSVGYCQHHFHGGSKVMRNFRTPGNLLTSTRTIQEMGYNILVGRQWQVAKSMDGSKLGLLEHRFNIIGEYNIGIDQVVGCYGCAHI